MKGYIRKRGQNSWQITVDAGASPGGKRKRIFETVRGAKRDAQRRLHELVASLEKGYSPPVERLTVKEYLERWLKDYVQASLSPKTSEGYEHICRRYLFPCLGNIKLAGLKPEHLQHYYSERLASGLSAQTVRHHHMVLHKALQTAVGWGLLLRNTADAVTPPPAQQPEMQTWNEDEIATFLQAARSTRYFALFHTLLFTGLRRSEALALRWCDIDLLLCQLCVTRSLHVAKGGRVVIRQPKSVKGRRMVALSPLTVSVLREHWEKQSLERSMLGIPLKEDDLVFSHVDGSPLLPGSVTHAWVKLVRRTGLRPIRLHDARHTHATLMLKQGTHPKVVQERLGHASIQVTLDIYSHVTPGLQEAAAARFDQAFTTRYNEHMAKENVANLSPKLDITLTKD